MPTSTPPNNNASAPTLAPLGSGPAGGSAALQEAGATLEAEGVCYRVRLDDSGLLYVEGRLGPGDWQPLLEGAGMLWGTAGPLTRGEDEAPTRFTRTSLEWECGAGDVRANIEETCEGVPVHRALDFRLLGGCLEVRVQAPGGPAERAFRGVALGAAPTGRPVLVPGLPEPLRVMPDGFACCYVDPFLGRASASETRRAVYRPDSEGRIRDLDETFYATLSPDPLAPLPGLRRSPAPYRVAVENRVTLDLFSDARYEDDERLIRALQAYGLDDVLLIYRNWQQYGYDRRSPALYPANPDRGSNEAFRRMVAAAAGAGWLVALREEYGQISGDSLYWNEKALSLTGDGAPRPARRPGYFGIAAHRMLDYARLETTKIQRNYRPTAGFVDGHTAISPEAGYAQVDDTAQSRSGTDADSVRSLENLTGFLRDFHEGPVVGAGGEGSDRFDTFAAGIVEGVIRGPDRGARAPLIVDYELRAVQPKLVGIGAGSYRQFSGRAGDHPVDARDVDWDAYRATEIALGHAGYVGNYRLKAGARGLVFPAGGPGNACREYFLMRAMQELTLASSVKTVSYAEESDWVDLAQALRREVDLTGARLRVEYANGLVVWVNRSPGAAWVVAQEEREFLLPPAGFLALAPRARFSAYTAEVGGLRTDFCKSSLYTFLDVRGGNARTIEGITTDGAVALLRSSVPSRQDVVLVGARELTLTEGEYRLSERADVRIQHRSVREIEVTLMDSDSGKPVHLQWPTFSAAWQAERLRVTEWADGQWLPGRGQVTGTRAGPQLSRLRPGGRYRVSISG